MAYKEVAPSGYQLNRSGEVIPNRMKTHLAPIGWKYLESGKMVRTNQFAQDISTQPRSSSNLGDMHRGLARSLFASPVFAEPRIKSCPPLPPFLACAV